MDELERTVWWQVYPLGAVAAPPGSAPDEPVVHRLCALHPWVDYAADLGFTGLLLGPVFASTSHGYDTVDHLAVDPRLGDGSDLDALVQHASERGVAVMLDGVFNHVGREHPLARAAYDGDRGAPVRWETRDGVDRPKGWEGHDDLVELDHSDERVAALVADVMTHWLRRGIAGWRLDVAYAVPPEFWRTVLGTVREEFPDAYFLGEVIHGDYVEIVRAATLDSVTQYELWKGIWSSLAEENLWELAWAVTRHDTFSRDLVLQTFVGNHDVTRIASAVGDAKAVLAVVALMTLPGMPSVYYGDEQAFHGVKGSGADADHPMRPALPDQPGDLPPDGWWMHDVHRRLVALRRENPWLARAHVEVEDKANGWIRWTTSDGTRSMTVELALAPQPTARVTVDGTTAFDWA